MSLTSVTLHELEFVRQRTKGSTLGFILDALGGGEALSSPEQGYFVGPLNAEKLIEGISVADGWKLQIEGIGSYPTSYYVDDSPEDFIRKYDEILRYDDRIFAVFFAPMRKEDQEPHGGWRWHKWGEYIGEKTPTTEYLYDEPKISVVYVVHVIEVTR